MAYERHDNVGARSKRDKKKYTYATRPVNLLDKGQNAMNDAARAGWDSAFTDKKQCISCPGYSPKLSTCTLTYSKRLCNGE